MSVYEKTNLIYDNQTLDDEDVNLENDFAHIFEEVADPDYTLACNLMIRMLVRKKKRGLELSFTLSSIRRVYDQIWKAKQEQIQST